VKIRKPISKNGLYIRANKGLDYWVTVEYENDKEVKVGYRAHYAYTDRTYWGEVDTFTVPTCSDAYADCRAPNVMLVQAADNILYCPPLRKEFIERGYEMPYSEIMSKLSKYVREGKCYYRACVPGGGGTFCAAQGTDAMDVAVDMARGY